MRVGSIERCSRVGMPLFPAMNSRCDLENVVSTRARRRSRAGTRRTRSGEGKVALRDLGRVVDCAFTSTAASGYLLETDLQTDRELLGAKLGSEAEARAVFEQFVRRHRDEAWKIALSVTRSPELAADAMQDAFLVAWGDREQVPAHVSISTWLHVTVRNAARRVDRLDRVAKRASPVGELPDLPKPDIANQVASRVDFEAAPRRRPADE